jgi:hypothetical protein
MLLPAPDLPVPLPVTIGEAEAVAAREFPEDLWDLA